jgi:hypothetical protein
MLSLEAFWERATLYHCEPELMDCEGKLIESLTPLQLIARLDSW